MFGKRLTQTDVLILAAPEETARLAQLGAELAELPGVRVVPFDPRVFKVDMAGAPNLLTLLPDVGKSWELWTPEPRRCDFCGKPFEDGEHHFHADGQVYS